METIYVKYLGELRTKSIHLQSKKEIITDAPIDNQGKGEAFSPTDMVASALASCILTLIGISANKHGFNIVDTEIKVSKIMHPAPRRIGEIKIDIYFPQNNYSNKEKKIIEHAAKTCPVAYSLHPDLKQSISFHYQ